MAFLFLGFLSLLIRVPSWNISMPDIATFFPSVKAMQQVVVVLNTSRYYLLQVAALAHLLQAEIKDLAL